MNQEMKEKHIGALTDPSAIAMYENLCAACEQREGGITDTEQMLIADVARAEEIKQQLIKDIRERGIGNERKNGRQTYYQENKSLAQLRAFCEQQRKALAELRLTPASRKAPLIPVDDDFGEF